MTTKNACRLAFAAALLAATVVSTPAFAQCDWTAASGKVTEDCGHVGVGTTSVNVLGSTASKTLTILSGSGESGRGILELGTHNDTASNYPGLIFFFNNAETNKESASIYVQADASGTTTDRGYSMQFQTKPYGGTATERLRIDSAGNVGIGMTPTYKLDVNGNARFSGTVTGGNIQAHFQDVAEWVPSAADLPPGTVVVLDSERTNAVTASRRPYDETVAGVVSAQPGLLLGEEGQAKEMIATTGRVKVRVDARKAPVKIGDLLVTSGTPGTAMKSERVVVGGIGIHRPGTIIGKALEPLAEGEGEILVLLSLQ